MAILQKSRYIFLLIIQMEKHKQILLQALEVAGKILEGSLFDRRVIEEKSELSLVTATDRASERAIIEIIRSEFPAHSILAEESPPPKKSGRRWIIDPLDGTTNFAHTFPHACISIAFEADGIIQIGGVFNPFHRELFLAERGKGATLNGKPISVSPTKQIGQSLLATGFPYDRRQRGDEYLALFRPFMMASQGVRRTGAAALDFCYVACGRFDGFWEIRLNPWDKAAGGLIVEEAGGKTSDFSGKPSYLDVQQDVASNGLIHDQMLKLLEPFRNMR